MGQQRRLHPRAVVRLPAELKSGRTEGWRSVLLHDLSAGGAGIHAGFPLPGRVEVRLRFRLPVAEASEGNTIEVAALVVRAAATVPPDHSRPHLYGLHFIDLHGEPFDRVAKYIWGLLHRNGD
jgi:hypothetical protein